MGRSPKSFKVYTGDEALAKILETKLPEKIIDNELTKLKEDLLTMRRHYMGGLIALDRIMTMFKPKCDSCMKHYGYLDKCICHLDRKAGLED